MSAGGEIIEGLVKVVFRQGAKRIGKMVTGAIGKKLSKDEAKEALEKLAEQKLAKATGKAKRPSKARMGDADYTGPLPEGSWTLAPDGEGAHLIERANVKNRPGLSQFDQKGTPRYYPDGSPENAGQAHIRLHQATKEAGIKLRGGNKGMSDSNLLGKYTEAYSNPSLEGIRGSLRTPDGKVNLGDNLTPAEAVQNLLKWGKNSQ